MASSAPRAQVPEVLKRQKCFLHIDLEQIRLGLTADVPLVSQQWNAIIAVNYSARARGITRLQHNVFDAKLLCPELVCAHVATLGPGDSKPDYYPSPSRYTHKVSLDPYRKASAKIFNVFRKFCPKYQKGGLDEVFMDITDIVNQQIMEEYGDDLSKWDREAAEMMDWKRDHPEAGVVFGLSPKVAIGKSSSNTASLDDDDDNDDEDEEHGVPLLEGIGNDEEEEDEQDAESDSEPANGAGTVSELGPNDIKVLEDDFDLDLEQLFDSDFDETSFSQPLSHIKLDKDDHSNCDHSPQSASLSGAGPAIKVNNADGTAISDELSEEELKREQEAKAELLRVELEQLLPYYGIPEGTFEEQFWAEMQILKAAEYCNKVRQAVKDELGYTCSAGVANNKLLAKLGSGMNKPFQQTIILPKYVPDLLHGLKLKKIRNLGGKFGKQVMADYNIERASQLWPVPLRKLQERYGDQAGLELWQWCRGIDHVGIRKVKSKSMCSHKSFIPALSDLEEIQFWLSSICLELVSRITAEYEETERWPRTIALGFYGGMQAYRDQQQQERSSTFRAPHKGSRSMPLGSRFEYGGVEGMARKMYGVVEKLIKEAETGRGPPILPLVILTVTVSNFSGGHGSAMGDITKFFSKAPVKRVESMATGKEIRDVAPEQDVDRAPETATLAIEHPHRPTDSRTGGVIASSEKDGVKARRRFFQPRTNSNIPAPERTSVVALHPQADQDPETGVSSPSATADDMTHSPQMEQTQVKATLLCERCSSPGQQVPVEEWEQHLDYHFALSLLEDDRKQQQLERQQQLQPPVGLNGGFNSASGGAKRGSPAALTASSSRGKRKKPSSSGTSSSSSSAAAASASSTDSSSSSASMPPLSKFFKPNTR
ncbi:DNA-directed DNA polymerase eta rad30 [Mortierella alpina]|nr:DNA-directed DNA polymerase eta rad30 [Mortierella alpina]